MPKGDVLYRYWNLKAKRCSGSVEKNFKANSGVPLLYFGRYKCLYFNGG